MPEASPSTPPSPPAGRLATPSWLDTRLVLGVLLVLVSVVVGARVLAAADRTELVYAADRDLAAGTVLQRDDLRPVEVRLLSVQDVYLGAPGETFVGYVVERDLLADELVPVDALAAPGDDADLRLVSVPVAAGHYPEGLARGERVDVWSTPDADTAAPADGERPAAGRLVLEAVPVSRQVEQGGALSGGSGQSAVVLAVPPDDVAALVAAMSGGRIDLVRVPSPVRAREELRDLGAGRG